MRKGQGAPARSLARGMRGDRQQATDRRLESVNNRLAELGLKPFVRPGDHRNGEWEVIACEGDHGNDFYRAVNFRVRRPDGTIGTYSMLYNVASPEADGAIVIPIVGGRLAFVRQHRPTLEVWTTELPRGFARNKNPTFMRPRGGKASEELSLPGDGGLNDLPLSVLGRELSGLIATGRVRLSRLVYLDDVAENTGTSRAIVPVHLAVFLADELVFEEATGDRVVGIRYYPWQEVLKRRRELGLRDQATLSALYLLREYLEEYPDFKL